MAHMAKFREGWANENLAQYILYKFAFIANPSKIADDTGIDFICTLFTSEKKKQTVFLHPKNSFALQIKSSKRKYDITKKIDLLDNLELPFLYGIVNKKDLSISFYSGEFLHLLFSYKGISGYRLQVKFTNRADLYTISDYFEEINSNSYILHFPFITEIKINEPFDKMNEKVALISETTSRILDNISSRRNHEYIFNVKGNRQPQMFIFAGSGSNRYFRKNLINRISEVIYNLNWLFNIDPNNVSYEEFTLYKNFMKGWDDLGFYWEEYYRNIFQKLENKIEEHRKSLIE